MCRSHGQWVDGRGIGKNGITARVYRSLQTGVSRKKARRQDGAFRLVQGLVSRGSSS